MSSYSTHRLNSDTSRIMLCSLHLPVSSPPQHKNRVVIICRPCYGSRRAELASWALFCFFLLCTSACAHPRFLEFHTLVHAFVINRDNVKWCVVVQRARHPTHTTNRDGWVILRVCARSVIHAQLVGSASTANAVVQNTFRDSQRVVCPSVGPRMILRGPCERLHGGGGCSHQLRAQVHGGAVIKFLVNLSKTQTSSASLNGKADATARRWSCGADLLSKTDTITAFKKNSSGSGFVTNLQLYIVFR